MEKSNKVFALELNKRSRKLAYNIIKLSSFIPRGVEVNVVRRQITRSACSVGANYREANCSRNKADFRSRIKICHSESNETLFWLEVIEDQNWVEKSKLTALYKEVNELAAIFATIGNKVN